MNKNVFPKVSIITVTYNSERTIEQTIKSVIEQTYTNIEYIVIDGMSTDKTMDILRRYKKYIHCLVHEKDFGLYDAMNKGIELASGDIIGILNSDDWYETDAIVNVVKNIEMNTDILYGRMMIYEDNKEIRISTESRIENIWSRMIPHPAVFVRKCVYQKYGTFDLQYKIAADYDMIFRFYRNGVRFQYIDQVFTNFRKGGLSSQRKYDCAREVYRIAMKNIGCCDISKRDFYLKQIEEDYCCAKMYKVYEQPAKQFYEHMNQFFSLDKQILCIFGAGVWGRRCLQKVKESGLRCSYFVDNNICHCYSDGIEIISPAKLKYMQANIIIAVSKGYGDIEKQLRAIGNPNLRWLKMFELCEEGKL